MRERKYKKKLYDTMLCQIRPLNSRQMYFARLILKYGFYVALKCSGYEKKYAFKLLRDPRIERYQMSLITDALDEIKLSLGELIKKRFELANDPKTPTKLRDEIYKDLINIAKDAGERVDETRKLTGSPGRFLKPSKEYYETEEND